MSRIKSVFLLVFILVSLGCWGCGVQSPRALVSHEGECVVNYITDSLKYLCRINKKRLRVWAHRRLSANGWFHHLLTLSMNCLTHCMSI